MWDWIKSKFGVKSAAKLELQAAQKPAETALIAAVSALFAEIEKVL